MKNVYRLPRVDALALIHVWLNRVANMAGKSDVPARFDTELFGIQEGLMCAARDLAHAMHLWCDVPDALRTWALEREAQTQRVLYDVTARNLRTRVSTALSGAASNDAPVSYEVAE
jgi:hypothetical protein